MPSAEARRRGSPAHCTPLSELTSTLMPRIPRSLLRKASAVDPLLPLLLGPCRDLSTAKNELRWLREHVQRSAKTRGAKEEGVLLKKLVQDRASGKPLQYILGTEYFGELEIACRPGVLIPRWERSGR
jgi:methylase of polypeptide subunit release factors